MNVYPFFKDELVSELPDISEEGMSLVWLGPDDKRYLVGVSLFELDREDEE